MKRTIFKPLGLFCLLLLLLAACSESPANTVFSPADLSGKNVGVIGGTAAESTLRVYAGGVNLLLFPDANALSSALRSGAIDAAVADTGTAKSLTRSAITQLEQPYTSGAYRIALSEENEALYNKLSAALSGLLKDGTIANLEKSWTKGKGTRWVASTLEPTSSLTVAVSPSFPPYAFTDEDGNLTGLEIELTRALCDRLGVGVTFREVEADRLTYLAETGKVSFSIGRLEKDGSRVLWTEPYIQAAQVILVRK